MDFILDGILDDYKTGELPLAQKGVSTNLNWLVYFYLLVFNFAKTI